MKVSFTVNNEHTTLDVVANERLISVLRNRLNLVESKMRCGSGTCGSCTVLFDGKPVRSCLIPAYVANGCTIVTIEHFRKTEEYADIVTAFEKAGVRLCGFCDASKYFGIDLFLTKYPRPTKEQIEAFIQSENCKCVDTNVLISGIIMAAKARRARIHE